MVGLREVFINMSELENELREIIPTSDISIQKILNNLLDAEKNLELKTHIYKPKQLTSLVVLGNYLKSIGLVKCAKIIEGFIKTYLEYMISYKRLSRVEIIKAISSINRAKEPLSTTDKFTTNLG